MSNKTHGRLKLCQYDYLARHGIKASRSTLLRWENEGRFPRRVRPGPHIVAWVQEEVDEYLEQLVAEREAI